jgi:hypothetical protein
MNHREFNRKLFAYKLVVVPVLMLVYGIVVSQGLRMTIPILATKLYRIPLPGFSRLEHFKNLRDLDMAHLLAMFMLAFVWLLLSHLLEIYFFGPPTNVRLDPSKYVRFISRLAAILLITDVAMFYRGISEQGGLLDSGGSVTPIIATIAYSALLVSVAFFHVMFKHRVL